MITGRDHSVSLHPIAHGDLITKVFEAAGYKATLSSAGLIARRIIEKLGGIESAKVFKVRGVRKLIGMLNSTDSVTKDKATKTIWNDGEFKKHTALYIEPRTNKDLKKDKVFEFLLKKEIFRAGLELRCAHCNLKSWLSLKELADIWTCPSCGDGNQTSLQLLSTIEWRFRKSGLFGRDNNQEGAIPVILTLLTFAQFFEMDTFINTFSLKLTKPDAECETDLCVIFDDTVGRQNALPEIAIGECKSEGGFIDQKCIDNLVDGW